MYRMIRLARALACALWAAAPAAWPAAPAVLEQPALGSPKALAAVTLALARAGSRLVAVGERGTILLSDDDGRSWKQAQVPVRTSLTAVQFVDAKSGWAVGHLGVVLKTEDGGQTWVKQLDGIRAAELVLQAARQDGDAKAIADARSLVDDGPDKPFFDLYFENARTGYIVGAYNLMFKTSDGGTTWQPWQAHVANPKGLHLYSIRAAGAALYVAGEQGVLLRSTDQGNSFTPLESPYKGTWFGLLAARGGALVAFGLRGNAFRSDDDGRSWHRIETGTQAAIAAGTELADGALVLVSQSGDLLVSRDHGRSFAAQKNDPLPLAAVAQARDNGLVVAGLRGIKRLAALPQ